MWMNHTVARGTPENIAKAVALLDKPEVLEKFSNAAGFRAVYLVANLEDPQEIISVTVWDSAAEGQAFYASQTYQEVFGGVEHQKDIMPLAPSETRFLSGGINSRRLCVVLGTVLCYDEKGSHRLFEDEDTSL